MRVGGCPHVAAACQFHRLAFFRMRRGKAADGAEQEDAKEGELHLSRGKISNNDNKPPVKIFRPVKFFDASKNCTTVVTTE